MTRICTQCDIEKEENEFYLILDYRYELPIPV
jgi:hypothetical protein